MEIKRETITRVMIDENRSLLKGDTVKFIANGICHLGTFVGVSKRGALQFDAVVGKHQITFNVMPASVEDIEVIEHESE